VGTGIKRGKKHTNGRKKEKENKERDYKRQIQGQIQQRGKEQGSWEYK